jgi:hypothetical protein
MTKFQNRSNQIKLLNNNHIAFVELASNNNASMIVTPSLGGRILGAFIDDKNLLWVNHDIGKDWNVGGHRTWYTPEWGPKSIYANRDETTWSVPNVMDPGDYKITKHIPHSMIEMKNDFDVITTDKTSYSLSFNRKITLKKNDLEQNIPFLKNKSLFVELEHTLENLGKAAINKEIGLWSIIQIEPPGKIVVQLKNANVDNYFCDNYYERIPKERIRKENNLAIIYVDGAKRYKLGFPPNKVLGKIAYLSKFKEDRYFLVVKSFEIDHDAIYVDKPYNSDRANGDVIQIYNHSEGGKLAFAELEAHAPAVLLLPGETQTFKIDMFFLTGTKKEIADAFSNVFNSTVDCLQC